jgi:hypothetical protein
MNTQRMFSLYDTMSLPELVDRLEALEEDHELRGQGWTPREATHRMSVTRRILAMVLGPPVLRAAGIKCQLECQLVAGPRIARGVVRELVSGGVRITTEPSWSTGTAVELHVWVNGGSQHSVHVGGTVRAVGRTGVKLALDPPISEAHERRLQRVLLAALHRRTAWTTS